MASLQNRRNFLFVFFLRFEASGGERETSAERESPATGWKLIPSRVTRAHLVLCARLQNEKITPVLQAISCQGTCVCTCIERKLEHFWGCPVTFGNLVYKRDGLWYILEMQFILFHLLSQT